MSKIKVMLDSNIYFNFAQIEFKTKAIKNKEKGEIPKSLWKSSEIYVHLMNGVFDNYVSNWNLYELRDILNKFLLERRLLKEGYSPEDFRDAKKEIFLNNNDFRVINRFINDIMFFSIWRFKNPELDFDFITKLTEKGFSFMDAILINQADNVGCDFFVTRDVRLKNYLLRHKVKLKFVQVVSREEFLAKLPRPL